MYKYLLVFLLFPFFTFAHVPELPEFSSYEDFKTIEDTTLSQAYYGELQGFPHTYIFQLDEAQELFVEILVPDIPEAKDEVNGLIVRRVSPSEVKEVSRLNYGNAQWESFYEFFGGDSYRRGSSFEAPVEPGEYLLEVNTPSNIGKYVLVVGKREDFSGIGYVDTLSRIYQVKLFYGKPPIAVLQSPFFAVPVVVMFLIGLFVWYRKTKQHA